MLRNTLFLVVAQLITTPLGVAVNGVMARYIGPAEFGRLYLAATFCSFGFLAVDWGQTLTLPGLVAKDRSRSGVLLGTALAWRMTIAPLVATILCVGALALDYEREFAVVLALVALGQIIFSVTSAVQETIRGFERTDVMAYSQVGGQILSGVASICVLVVGGDLRSVLVVQAVCALLVLGVVWRVMSAVGVASISFDKPTLRTLAKDGAPLMMFGLAMLLQPTVDALFLKELTNDEVVGWHAAARRLVGALVFPAGAIIGALYPTLSRLHAQDHAGYVRTANTAIQSTTVLAVPLAVGCFMYPDVGIMIFSRETFGPAEDNLRIFAFFLLLVYFSMPLGCTLLASGRQRAWALVQSLCVIISLVLDPILVPYFQETHGNGGLGVCYAGLGSEVFMVSLGMWMAPKGIFDRALLRKLFIALAAGGVMVGSAVLTLPWSPFIGAPIAMVVYALSLWLMGGVDPEQVDALKRTLRRKFSKSGAG